MAQITGVIVRETVPDTVLEQADEVELIDIPPDDLLKRLRRARSTCPSRPSRAVERFFKKGNLIALRELALRRMTAERVNGCHSPRNMLGAERAAKAMTGGTYRDDSAGGVMRSWSAPNLTPASSGLGSWSVDEIAAYLKAGTNSYATTFGPMNSVILKSTTHLRDADLRAMAVYLKSLPPNEGDFGAPAKADVLQAGETIYNVNCGTCHQPDGMGADDAGPRLAGNPVTQASDPASLINSILYGPDVPSPAPGGHQWRPMEAYGEKLSDEEVAALASYLRSAWRNQGGEVTARQVAQQR